MKPNSPQEQQLLLYLFDELDDAERAEVEARVQQEPAYRAMLEDMRALREAARASVPEPSEEALSSLNREIAHRIRVRSRAGDVPSRFGARFFQRLFRPPVLVRGAVVVLIFVLGFLLGSRSGHQRAPLGQDALWEALLTETASPEARPGRMQPWLPDLERFSFDPGTGQLNVRYALVHEAHAEGTLEHHAVRQVVRWALLQSENATFRLRAIKAVDAFVARGHTLDPELLAALLRLVDIEDRPALRLHLLRALALAASEPSVREVLMQVWQTENDAALRIEAFEALVRGADGQAAAPAFLELAKADSNVYIRHRAFALEQKAWRAKRQP